MTIRDFLYCKFGQEKLKLYHIIFSVSLINVDKYNLNTPSYMEQKVFQLQNIGFVKT